MRKSHRSQDRTIAWRTDSNGRCWTTPQRNGQQASLRHRTGAKKSTASEIPFVLGPSGNHRDTAGFHGPLLVRCRGKADTPVALTPRVMELLFLLRIGPIIVGKENNREKWPLTTERPSALPPPANRTGAQHV